MSVWTRRRATRAGARRLDFLNDHSQDDVLALERELLLDDARRSARSEERRRLARELHDGVGQRIVALGYLADEVGAQVAGSAVEQTVETLREEITGIARDLRGSVLDLREGPDAEGRVVESLATYAREEGRRSGVPVHLRLEPVIGASRAVERELLAVGQEAVANAVRHAACSHLWVTLAQDASGLRLCVEDDGVGGAAPRPGHYGLQGMRERAERIGARLDVADRPGHGTTVTLARPSTPLSERGAGDDHHDDHQRLARR
jgi:signal transduction histidine kinase